MTETVRTRLGTALVVAAAAMAAVTWAGFLGSTWPGADVLAHFRLQYQLAFLALLASALVFSRWRVAAAVAVLAAPNALALGMAWAGPSPDRATTPDVTIVALNVLASNRSYGPVREYLNATTADVVVMQEVDPAWLDALAPALERYPYRIERPRGDNFGLAVYSRHPWTAREVSDGPVGLPIVVATVQTERGPVQCIAVHLVPPLGDAYRRIQREQAGTVRSFVRPSVPTAVIGDLNATPWGRTFRHLLVGTGLERSNTRGLHATWPAQFGRLGIPIDHALHSQGLHPLFYEVGPDLGSDHRPIRVGYRLEERIER